MINLTAYTVELTSISKGIMCRVATIPSSGVLAHHRPTPGELHSAYFDHEGKEIQLPFTEAKHFSPENSGLTDEQLKAVKASSCARFIVDESIYCADLVGFFGAEEVFVVRDVIDVDEERKVVTVTKLHRVHRC